MQTNKSSDSGTNLHLSMIADHTKLLNQADNKISVDINSPIINEFNNNEFNNNEFNNNEFNNNELNNNELNDSSNNIIIEDYSNEENSSNKNNSNNSSNSNNSNFSNASSHNIENIIKSDSPRSEKNIDAQRFNINPDTIPYNNLDANAKKFKKMEKLAKLIELKNRGYNLTKNYTIESDYDEMCFEIEHWTKYQKKKDGVELGKSFLMNAITAMEFLNDRYDPFGVNLTGWSEHVKVTSDGYNDVFSELYDKYRYSDKKVEPEIKLLLMLTASAVTFHTSKSLSNSMGGLNENILKGLSSQINKNISGNNPDNTTFNQKQQDLYNNVKNQQNMSKPPAVKQTNNQGLQSMLNSLKQNNQYDDESSDISVSSTITLGSEKKKDKRILKINTS